MVEVFGGGADRPAPVKTDPGEKTITVKTKPNGTPTAPLANSELSASVVARRPSTLTTRVSEGWPVAHRLPRRWAGLGWLPGR